ncbi:tRNA pseudouridine(55) synthase TruB [Vagococcus vulneris]|uniref:tRNA pseudouridine synthase B n=1 Tax=Vagococcus vulneris TaxID=1977869 RepID=A0A429ZWX4_9ENTE|nr:tRNA pseudouridine(55) synthase TruB [Vagococcus vulneris]RST98311.1 tRNA pseudouridine(55) synthase TruB [Vagococcus vulneris]
MNGIIPLWKPRGMTSHDCVFKLRKILRTKKVGHSGTLDPDVDGVLPICIGRATKVVEYLQDSRKIYIGEITLGYSTETEDKSGAVVEETPLDLKIPEEKIDEIMSRFIGEIKQKPPMYSAVKVNGRRLYDYARAGETVERPTRCAQIYSYKRTSSSIYDDVKKTQSWKFEVECGKGTYVRTLAVDTGKLLGKAAHMSDLTRISSGGFYPKDSVSLEDVNELMSAGNIDDCLYPLETALTEFTRIDISSDQYKRVRDGSVLPDDYFGLVDWEKPVAIFYKNYAVCLYGKHPHKNNCIKPIKVLRND